NAFRIHYYRYCQAVHNAAGSGTDSTVLERLGDDLDVFANLINEHANIFEPEELNLFQNNVRAMQNDVRQQYEHTLNHSHYGHPVVVQTVRTGRQGRPAVQIDPDFLRWAYSVRSTSAISRFLNVSRQTVRNALLEHGIVQPQADPFLLSPETAEETELATLGSRPILSFTGSLSTLTDQELDEIILNLRQRYRRLIRWGIVIHGFIDGYSRLITALQASNNNLGQTVLELFLSA
ncbi:hypothetical protein FPV67DRAFT_1382712, partial [Lyophyllum atratum]